jgi:hypothetical protein
MTESVKPKTMRYEATIKALKKMKASIRLEVQIPVYVFTSKSLICHLPPFHKLDSNSLYYPTMARELRFLSAPLDVPIDIAYNNSDDGGEPKILELNGTDLAPWWEFHKAKSVCPLPVLSSQRC